MHYRAIEKITKAVANHRRIQLLDILSRQPRLSVVDLSHKTRANLKTIDVHINRLFTAGLVTKHSRVNAVLHALTPAGAAILKFLRTLE